MKPILKGGDTKATRDRAGLVGGMKENASCVILRRCRKKAKGILIEMPIY